MTIFGYLLLTDSVASCIITAMLINVTKIKSTAEKLEALSVMETIDAAGYGYGELVLTAPVEFRGTIEHAMPYFHLNGEMTAELELVCARCLTSFRQSFTVSVDEAFTNREEARSEDDEVSFFTGDELDITPALLKALFLEIPMHPLCQSDCRGLCPGCGTDLNKSDCVCKHDDVDWRLEKLKTLFTAMNDDEEV